MLKSIDGAKVMVRAIYENSAIDGKIGTISQFGCNKFWLDENKSMLHLERQTIVQCTEEQAKEYKGYALVSVKGREHYTSYWLHLSSLIVVEDY